MALSELEAKKEFSEKYINDTLSAIENKIGIKADSYVLRGWGGQGLIIEIVNKTLVHQICAKIPHIYSDNIEDSKHAILKEALINKELTKRNLSYIPRLINYSETGDYLIREFIEGDLLEHVIKKNLDIESRIHLAYSEWKLASDIFNLVHNLQPAYVIRDFKPKNMVVTTNYELMMFDLGSFRREDNMVSRKKLRMLKRFGSGKFKHWPLEQLLEKQEACSRKVDYFALGVMLFRTLYGTYPYSNSDSDPQTAYSTYLSEYEGIKRIINENDNTNNISDELKTLLLSSLNPDPEQRRFIEYHVDCFDETFID